MFEWKKRDGQKFKELSRDGVNVSIMEWLSRSEESESMAFTGTLG
jgi:hypothetical protein